jgi:hypothetical protein
MGVHASGRSSSSGCCSCRGDSSPDDALQQGGAWVRGGGELAVGPVKRHAHLQRRWQQWQVPGLASWLAWRAALAGSQPKRPASRHSGDFPMPCARPSPC